MNPLHLPLAQLPGPAPVVWRGESDWMVLAVGHDEALIVRHAGDDDICHGWEPLADLALDLTDPPADTQGHPTRIDGLDLAAGMLARAMGLDPRGGVSWGRHSDLPNWTLAGGHRANGYAWSPTFAAGRGGIPALADIDPANPHADRLAMIAVFAAAPWRK